jgi:hypothetical protein
MEEIATVLLVDLILLNRLRIALLLISHCLKGTGGNGSLYTATGRNGVHTIPIAI